MIPRNSLHKTTLNQILQKPAKHPGFPGTQPSHATRPSSTLKDIQVSLQKYKWKGIKSLDTNPSQITKGKAKKFADILSRNQISFEKLDVESWVTWENNGKEVEALAYKISRNCKDLKYLSINLKWGKQSEYQALQIFAKELAFGLQNIKALSFQFKKSASIPAGEIEIFSRFLSRSYNLQELSINFNGTAKVDLEGIARWICTKLTKLRRLSLELEETGIEDEDLNEFTYRIGKHLRELKNLRLLFGDTKITEKGIRTCMNNLGVMDENLKEINIRFPQPKVDNVKQFVQKMATDCPGMEVFSRFGFLAYVRNTEKKMSLTRS